MHLGGKEVKGSSFPQPGNWFLLLIPSWYLFLITSYQDFHLSFVKYGQEEEHRLRKVALNISKDVKKFWIKIEKLVSEILDVPPFI